MAITDTTTTTADIIRACQERSNLCWRMAIETADAGTESEWAAQAEECDEYYDEALGLLADPLKARISLQCAQALERAGGDDQHARAAIEAIDGLHR